jgi:hypothetical protein
METLEAAPARPAALLYIENVLIGTLADGARSQSNRDYRWKNVPTELGGRRYTVNAGGASEKRTVVVKNPGIVYAAIPASEQMDRKVLEGLGFNRTPLEIQ